MACPEANQPLQTVSRRTTAVPVGTAGCEQLTSTPETVAYARTLGQKLVMANFRQIQITNLRYGVAGSLAGRLAAGWLAGWLAALAWWLLLAGWLLAGWLPGCLAGWLAAGWLAAALWLAGSPRDRASAL